MIVKKDIQVFGQAHRILLRENDYVYLLPALALRGQISNYTITFPNKKTIPDCYTVLPHGCATLVFSIEERGMRGDLFGPATKPCMVGGLANQCHLLLIIEFQPAGLSAFTSMNQIELANRTIPFETVNPALNRLILQILEIVNDLDELAGCLDRCLLQNLHVKHPCQIQTAAKMLATSNGKLTNQELSGCVNYSARHLNRMFETYLGMNTKTFSRMVRINKAIRLMKNPQCSITSVSLETGFYDLPHFIHEFKSVCGMTPQEYRNNMSVFYSEIVKFK